MTAEYSRHCKHDDCRAHTLEELRFMIGVMYHPRTRGTILKAIDVVKNKSIELEVRCRRIMRK